MKLNDKNVLSLYNIIVSNEILRDARLYNAACALSA